MADKKNDGLNQFVRQYSKPYNPETDIYEKPPYDKAVVAGKNTPIYNTHSYHTKVPYQGIIPFIEHYSEPDDLILDPFCGTGMTGIAGLLAPSGSRRVVLNDLSPAATHIARNYCTPCDINELKMEFDRIKTVVKEDFNWLYETYHEDLETGEKIPATIQYTIWSDVYLCAPKKQHDPKKHPINPDGCGHEIVLWDVAVDRESGQVKDTFKCPNPQCGETWKKTDLPPLRSVPVLISYVYIDPKQNKPRRGEHRPTDFELQRLREIESKEISDWYPTDSFDDTREMWRGVHRDQRITRACDFYTKRNLWALARLWTEIDKASRSIQGALKFAFTGIASGVSLMNRFVPRKTSYPYKLQPGVMYIPSLRKEYNVWFGFKDKLLLRVTRAYRDLKQFIGFENYCLTGHAGQLPLPEESIDYIFTDPPLRL